MVDRARAELDRERDRARLGELVAVEAEREPGSAARLQVAAGLRRVEGAALEEDVRGLGEPRSLGQHLARARSRGRRRASSNSGGTACAPSQVGTPPAARIAAQRGELGLAVEPVAGLRPPRSSCRRASIQPRCRRTAAREPLLAGRARRADGREDPAARGVQLLVARAARRAARTPRRGRRAKHACVWQSTSPGTAHRPAAVELLDVAVERGEVAHPPDGGDRAVLAEDVRVLEHVHLAERGAAQGCAASRGRRELGEVADEQPPRRRPQPGRSPLSAVGALRARARRRLERLVVAGVGVADDAQCRGRR